jgi:hypothetical protein
MHSPRSWSVFLSLQTNEKEISLYLDPKTTAQEASVSLIRDHSGEARRMIWSLGAPGDQTRFDSQITRILESQEIMNRGRFFLMLPKGIRRRLSSSGRDEKYEMVSRFNDQYFHGIMEEVRYHE